jgi:phosphohistidine phosphatase
MREHTLILLRHAKSDWSGGEADIDRPLAKRGKRQAPEAGQWLAGSVERIDLAVVSPAERARTTWKLASAELPSPPRVQVDDRVHAASTGELLDVVRDLPEDAGTVVMVGHNPGMEDLLTLLTGEWTSMPTSALAMLRLAGEWTSAGRGTATVLAAGRPPTALA